MYSADDVKKMLNGDNTGTSSAGYIPVTTKDIKKMLDGYDFTNKQSVLRDKSNKPMPVNTGYKKALPAVQGVGNAPQNAVQTDGNAQAEAMPARQQNAVQGVSDVQGEAVGVQRHSAHDENSGAIDAR